jgi:hypothetical protein
VVGQHGELYEVNAIRKVIQQLGSHLQTEAGLTRASWTCERHQAHIGATEHLADRRDLFLPADQ